MRKVLPLFLLLGACSSAAAVDTTVPVPPRGSTVTTLFEPESPVVVEYEADLPVEVYAPEEPGPYPVVVTVHGGAWVGGEPAYMAPLADALAQDGVVVFNVTYHTMGDGGRFPDMVQDVACGMAYARAHAAEYTTTPDRVYLAGHSSGAHLSALVAFAPDEFPCPDGGAAAPDGFIGLAGPYDVTRIPILNTLFGVTAEENPDLWASGNPSTYADSMPDIPVLLIHGDSDTTVPVDFTEQLAQELTAAGADVTVEVLPGGTHPDAADPAIVGEAIRAFLG